MCLEFRDLISLSSTSIILLTLFGELIYLPNLTKRSIEVFFFFLAFFFFLYFMKNYIIVKIIKYLKIMKTKPSIFFWDYVGSIMELENLITARSIVGKQSKKPVTQLQITWLNWLAKDGCNFPGEWPNKWDLSDRSRKPDS